MNKAINIILSTTNTQSPVFIEIEDDEGNSVRVGEQINHENDIRKIRITPNDFNDVRLNPMLWTKEMHDAWNRNLPDIMKSFEALRNIKV